MVLGFLRALWGSGDDAADHPTRDEMLVRLVNLRQRKDTRLRGANRPGQWPMLRFYKAPEATILDTVADYWWLRDGGLAEQSALQRLEWLASGTANSSSGLTLRALITRAILKLDPIFLGLGEDLLAQQLAMAETWAHNDIQRVKSQPSFPPIESLRKRIDISDADAFERDHTDWPRIQARLTENDELWQFSTGSSQGLAVVRNNRAIAHITTIRFSR